MTAHKALYGVYSISLTSFFVTQSLVPYIPATLIFLLFLERARHVQENCISCTFTWNAFAWIYRWLISCSFWVCSSVTFSNEIHPDQPIYNCNSNSQHYLSSLLWYNYFSSTIIITFYILYILEVYCIYYLLSLLPNKNNSSTRQGRIFVFFFPLNGLEQCLELGRYSIFVKHLLNFWRPFPYCPSFMWQISLFWHPQKTSLFLSCSFSFSPFQKNKQITTATTNLSFVLSIHGPVFC